MEKSLERVKPKYNKDMTPKYEIGQRVSVDLLNRTECFESVINSIIIFEFGISYTVKGSIQNINEGDVSPIKEKEVITSKDIEGLKHLEDMLSEIINNTCILGFNYSVIILKRVINKLKIIKDEQ